jgi:quercetin dioxygenase-like cupin family protein
MNRKLNLVCPISIARNIRWWMFGILKVFLLLSCAIASASAAEPGRVTELMTKALANVPGKEVTMITVDYPPGATDPVHRHYASAFVYVLEGSIVMPMKGGKKVTLHPGQTFYEDPNGVHLIGRNASDTKPASSWCSSSRKRARPFSYP